MLWALVVIAWLSISSASIIVLLSGASALVCAFWRLFIATLIISAYSIVFKTRSYILIRDLRTLFLSATSGVFLALHFLAWMGSLFYVPVFLSTTIVVLYPLISMLYEALLGLSRPRLSELIGIATAFCGTVVAVQPYMAGEALYGSTLAFLGALTGAAYFTIGRYLRREGISLAGYTIICYGFSTIFLLIYSVLTSQSILPEAAHSWIYLVALALIPMIGGHTVINYLMRYMKSYVATVIGFGEAPGSAILASIILSQKIEPNVVMGMSLVFLGSFCTIRELKTES